MGATELSTNTAEELIVPLVRTIENELFRGGAASQARSRVYQEIRELIEQLSIPPSNSDEASAQLNPKDFGLAIVPFLSEGDEVVARILARLLEAKGVGSNLLSWKTLRTEKLERLKELDARCVVLSAIGSRAAVTVGKMARAIQGELPDIVIVIGLWSLPPAGAARLIRRIRESSVLVYTSLDEALRGISALALPPPQEQNPKPAYP